MNETKFQYSVLIYIVMCSELRVMKPQHQLIQVTCNITKSISQSMQSYAAVLIRYDNKHLKKQIKDLSNKFCNIGLLI